MSFTDNYPPGVTAAMIDRNGSCDACEEELPDDCLLNENGQFCDEACEADYLAPKTLAGCVARDYGVMVDRGQD